MPRGNLDFAVLNDLQSSKPAVIIQCATSDVQSAIDSSRLSIQTLAKCASIQTLLFSDSLPSGYVVLSVEVAALIFSDLQIRAQRHRRSNDGALECPKPD